VNIRLDLRSIPYQPFLIAAFIGISIYAPNRHYFSVEVMILPMCILISLIGAALIVLKYAQLDMNKGLIFISGALLLNFTYYAVYDMLSWGWQVVSPATIIYGMLFILLVVLVRRATRSQARDLAQIFGVVAISLVIIGSANLVFSIVSDAKEISDKGNDFETQFQKYLAEDLTSPLNDRDFYFIILDRYPGEETLYAESGFNNSDFYANLSSLGFYLIEKSKSNYGSTGRSIPSMLNMDYYEAMKGDGYNEEYNRLSTFFKSQGFKFIFLPSNWATTTTNNNADIILNPYPIDLKYGSKEYIFLKIMFFERSFIGKIYYSVLHIVFNLEMPSQSIDTLQMRIQNPGDNEQKEFTEQLLGNIYLHTQIAKYHVPYTFMNLTQIPKISDKKFIFSHINHWEWVDYPSQIFGINGDMPIVGDWNGDGKDTIGVFREGMWYLDYDNDGVADEFVHFGASKHLPVTGDWNGDGKDTIGVFDPSTGVWSLDYDNDKIPDKYVNYGASHRLPVTGDWKGSGKDNVGVFDTYSAMWSLENDNPVAGINQLVESLVKVLIDGSETKPIIVIMSDHGRRPPAKAVEENRAIYKKYANYPNESLEDDDIRVSWYTVDNFMAFYLPDGGDKAIYPGMTPVNAWRMILNYYFGTDLPRINDKCYWKWRYSSLQELATC